MTKRQEQESIIRIDKGIKVLIEKHYDKPKWYKVFINKWITPHNILVVLFILVNITDMTLSDLLHALTMLI